MDFDQLNTFLEVAKHSSFSKAAEKCFRTQPAISAQIRALEEEVEAKLFDRSGGRVALTAAGKTFQRFAEQTIESRRNMMLALAEMEKVPRGEILVGANEGTCLHILPEVFAEFKHTYPKVAVNITRLERAKTLESIHDNTVDFGVVAMPVSDKRLDVVPIHRDELVLIVPAGHALARRKSVTTEDFARFPVVLPKLGRTRDAIDNLFHSRGLKPDISMELGSSELLKRFVAANVGIGIIARSNVAEDVKAGVLVPLRIEGVNLRRDMALVYRKEKALSRAARAFIEIAVKHRANPGARVNGGASAGDNALAANAGQD